MIRRLIILLLIVGLFSQEEKSSIIRFNPETGEIINLDSTQSNNNSKIKYNPETGEIINPDSLVLISPEVDLFFKDISIKDLTKKQKKKYNQNKIRIRVKDFRWYAYTRENIFFSRRITQSDFFMITGYPELAQKAKANQSLAFNRLLIGLISSLIGSSMMENKNNGDFTSSVGFGISFLVPCALYIDYNLKKHKGVGLKDARKILEKYNKDLIQNIIKENYN